MIVLHTAYTYSVVPVGNGVIITLREKPKTVLDSQISDVIDKPREVVFHLAASNTVERVCSFMNSLTDDLIYNQWFKVKTHKQKKPKESK